jgi:hypothetical protein
LKCLDGELISQAIRVIEVIFTVKKKEEENNTKKHTHKKKKKKLKK